MENNRPEQQLQFLGTVFVEPTACLWLRGQTAFLLAPLSIRGELAAWRAHCGVKKTVRGRKL
jgi:hypothetical protein